MKKEYVLIAISSILSILSLYFGFSIIGSPIDQRGKKLDQDRVTRLGNLQMNIEDYYRPHGYLPKYLKDLTDNSGYTSFSESNTKDPETGDLFEYEVTGQTSYKLCATFSTDSIKGDYSSTVVYSPYANAFVHPKGNKCFELQLKNVVPIIPTIYNYISPTTSVQLTN